MLDYYRENLNAITRKIHGKDQVVTVIAAIRMMLDTHRKSLSGYHKYAQTEESLPIFEHYLITQTQGIIMKQVRYLGTLESLLMLIEEEISDAAEREIYDNLIRSQLTTYEAKFIFFQCLASKPIGKFQRLIHTSKLLDERIGDMDISKPILRVYAKYQDYSYEKRKNKYFKPYKLRFIRKLRAKIDDEKTSP